MKKVLVTLLSIVLAVFAVNAQDMAKATELAKQANEALGFGENQMALDGFRQALTEALACGEEGTTLANTCKEVIPKLLLSTAKDMAKATNYDDAIARLQETVKTAKEYGDEETIEKATELIPQISMQKGASLLNGKKFDEAVTVFNDLFTADPTNGQVAIRLGQALNASGKSAEAKEIFKKAVELGQESVAKKQLSTIALKEAAAALKTKDYAAAVAAAVESNEWVENAQALQIAGQASQISGKNNDAIKYFEKFLEVSPNAKNAATVAYTVGALYQKAGNKAKAVEFYKKVLADPVLGPEAKKLVDALK